MQGEGVVQMAVGQMKKIGGNGHVNASFPNLTALSSKKGEKSHPEGAQKPTGMVKDVSIFQGTQRIKRGVLSTEKLHPTLVKEGGRNAKKFRRGGKKGGDQTIGVHAKVEKDKKNKEKICQKKKKNEKGKTPNPQTEGLDPSGSNSNYHWEGG